MKIHEPIISKNDPRYRQAYQELMTLGQNRMFGGYKVIYADPPWLFENWSLKGAKRGALSHYPCMSTELIASLPVSALVGEECMLYMWCTWPMMRDAFRILDGWGFEYKGLGWEWIKKNPKTGKYSFGTGYGTRKNLEPCIMAKIGDPKIKTHKERDFMYAPKRKHSQKPIEAYEKIERLSDGPYIELFARNNRDGWNAWGNEIS